MTRRSPAPIVGLFALLACAKPAPAAPVAIELPPVAPDPSAARHAPNIVPVTPVPPAVTDHRALLDPSLATARAPDVFRARFRTTQGDFVVEVHRDWSPHCADRFYNLVRIGFYDGTRFFRVIDGFMVQWGIHGDPAVSAAWRDAQAQDDPHVRSNVRGTITFARTNAPNSATTQLFVNYGDNSRLDASGFTPFGEIVEGMTALESLYKGYGEQPSQAKIVSEGNRYLLDGYPKLDGVLDERVEGE